MYTRRDFLEKSFKTGAIVAPLHFGLLARQALGQLSPSTYKAVIIITLGGGNDANNMVVPLDAAEYRQYSLLRGNLSLPAASLLPLSSSSADQNYGFHPMLPNVAALYNQGRVAVIANIGPLAGPLTKDQILTNRTLLPQLLQNHPVGQQQWESATTVANPTTGWGGRIADLITAQSGSLPPVLNTARNSIFAVGESAQAVVLQSGGAFAAIPAELNSIVLQMAKDGANVPNHLVAQLASFRASAMQQEVILDQALKYTVIKQVFTPSPLGKSMQTIAQLLAGRCVIGASRQIFYTQQFGYDTHNNQLGGQAQLFSDLDKNLGAFFAALDDLGLREEILVCTHSDFGRTITGNSGFGTDHGWGNHQLLLGGGTQGGRIIGTMPILDLAGPDDLYTQGVWIPTLSVTQLTAAIGSWMGLSASQLASVFPDLTNFPTGPVKLN